MKKLDALFLQDNTKTLTEFKALVPTKDAASVDMTLFWYETSTVEGVRFNDNFSLLAAAVNFQRYDFVEYLLLLGTDPNARSSLANFPCLLLAQEDQMHKLLIANNADYLSALHWVAEDGLQSNVRPFVLLALKRLLKYLSKHVGSTPEISLLLSQHASKLGACCDAETVELIKQLTVKIIERFEVIIKALVSNTKLDEQDATLLKECHNNNNKVITANGIIDALYELLIGKQYNLVFDNLIRIEPSNPYLHYAQILLVHCYINQLGCEKNLPRAYELLKQLLNSDNAFIKKLALEMFEKMDAPYNKTQEYHSILGSIYRKQGQYPAAIMHYAETDEFTPQLQREIFWEKAKAQVGNAEETLPAYERAADAGSTEAWIHIGDCYRDGKIGEIPDYPKAINCYCRAALTPNGFAKAVPSFNYLLNWLGISDETKKLGRQLMMELQFQLYVVEKIELTTALLHADESPLLACVMRECFASDGKNNSYVKGYYFTKQLKAQCQLNYLGRASPESIYAHFLCAHELMVDGYGSWVVGIDKNAKVQALLHVVAGLLIYTQINADQLVLCHLQRRFRDLLGKFLQHTDAEIRDCAEYLQQCVLNDQMASRPVPKLISSQSMVSANSNMNSLPECLLEKLRAPKLPEPDKIEEPEKPAPTGETWIQMKEFKAARDRDADMTDALAFVALGQIVRQNRGALRYVQHLAPGSCLGQTGIEGKKIIQRSHSF